MSLALPEAERFARVRLLRSPHVGPVTYYHLLSRFGSAEAALPVLPDLAARGGAPYRLAAADRIEAEFEAAMRGGAHYLFHDGPDYPLALLAIDHPPPVLSVRGDLSLFDQPAVAMVGARNASAGAVRMARDFSAGLAARGFVVISGLARGIDAAAHLGALGGRRGDGGTIAVIAGGIDVVYPPDHAELQERIANEGLLVAEMPPGTEPQARHFPSRNRIIAGLAAGTVVIEAAPKSGSLITARLAGEYGREVMAVPGSPLDARAQGCNRLIREGAILVQSAEDIAELVETFEGTARSTFRDSGIADYQGSDPEEADSTDLVERIAGLLGTAPVAIDELIRQSGAAPGTVQDALLDLELAGRLVRHAGGRVSLMA
ncbi:DNA-processing protein DprA [Novosphingobium sp. Fuku2-ISO-50]|uniref:DNA-processing protein DprA n=1 Tax=Novosphingobium sp. Fuku2-ISO-50 TaxID=1739114 RepID=UPI00076D0D7B|nr:DNA-processing protein DprA [Novosphingobium sp. Fuku2-ISO-50]KUR77945.1 DNA processing protein DprA [Novosphingobium sp. Fuku2-ISO-50]